MYCIHFFDKLRQEINLEFKSCVTQSVIVNYHRIFIHRFQDKRQQTELSEKSSVQQHLDILQKAFKGKKAWIVIFCATVFRMNSIFTFSKAL